MIRKTSAMVEAGILAAIAVIMALVAFYVPFLGMFALFLWPLPFIICGYRNGLKWSIPSLLIASFLIAIFISPIQAFSLGTVFGFLGVVLGECMHRHLKPAKMLLYGSVAALIAFGISIATSFLIMGMDPFAMTFGTLGAESDGLGEVLRKIKDDDEFVRQTQASYQQSLEMMKIIMPASMVILAPLVTLSNYYVAKLVLQRAGERFEDLPSPLQFAVPGWTLLPYVFSIFGVTFYYQFKHKLGWLYDFAVKVLGEKGTEALGQLPYGYEFCTNVQAFFSLLMVAQGVVLLYWFVEKHGKPRKWAHIGVGVMFFVPLFSMLMAYLGVFDIIFDYRGIRGKNITNAHRQVEASTKAEPKNKADKKNKRKK